MGRQCGLSQFYQVCLCFLFNLLLSQKYDLTSMIFTVPLWGSEVTNSKTDTSYKYSRRGGHAMSYIYDVTTIEREGDFTSLGICYCFS